MDVRYYIDPETGEPHVFKHGVRTDEVEDVLLRPGEDRPGSQGARLALGTTKAGRCLRVIYVPDATPNRVFVITAYELTGKTVERLPPQSAKETRMIAGSSFPDGWDEDRVRRVLDHYEEQSEEQAVAEDEAPYEDRTQSLVEIPVDLVPEVRALIAKHRRTA